MRWTDFASVTTAIAAVACYLSSMRSPSFFLSVAWLLSGCSSRSTSRVEALADARVGDASQNAHDGSSHDYATECGCDWDTDICVLLSSSSGTGLVGCSKTPPSCVKDRTCTCVVDATGFCGGCTNDGGDLIVTELQ